MAEKLVFYQIMPFSPISHQPSLVRGYLYHEVTFSHLRSMEAPLMLVAILVAILNLIMTQHYTYFSNFTIESDNFKNLELDAVFAKLPHF